MSTSEQNTGEICKVCGRPVPGDVFPLEAVMAVHEIEDFNLAAYRCQSCGATACLECMQARVQKGDLGRTPCPVCGKAFGPGEVVVKPTLELPLRQRVEENQKAMRKKMPRIRIHWISVIVGLLICWLCYKLMRKPKSLHTMNFMAWRQGIEITEVYMRISNSGLLLFFSGLLSGVWQSPRVFVFQGILALVAAAVTFATWFQPPLGINAPVGLIGCLCLAIGIWRIIEYQTCRSRF